VLTAKLSAHACGKFIIIHKFLIGFAASGIVFGRPHWRRNQVLQHSTLRYECLGSGGETRWWAKSKVADDRKLR
jgi:hypothetical protein